MCGITMVQSWVPREALRWYVAALLKQAANQAQLLYSWQVPVGLGRKAELEDNDCGVTVWAGEISGALEC